LAALFSSKAATSLKRALIAASLFAQALAAQNKDAAMRARFKEVAALLEKSAAKIDAEMINCQGSPVDVGGYFKFDPIKVNKAMRPSPTFNAIIDAM